MRVGDIAVGRAGDKGDMLDLTLVAQDEAAYELMSQALTTKAVAQMLNKVVPGPVLRYDLPGLRALKFVLPEALLGGVYASLRPGLHWQKAAMWLLLDLDIHPETLALSLVQTGDDKKMETSS
jgi:thiosulfate reductase cytochrome b subunit